MPSLDSERGEQVAIGKRLRIMTWGTSDGRAAEQRRYRLSCDGVAAADGFMSGRAQVDLRITF
jgi:hypothetical protein